MAVSQHIGSGSRSRGVGDWSEGYSSLDEEHAYWIEDIEGEVPVGLRGTLFRNGPGRFERGGVAYKHPFDGDGMICALTFTGDRVHFRNRFVRTEGYVRESAAGRILFKNVFGTLRPGGFWNNAFDFSFKNVANTNVILYAGRLLALWEAAPPYRLEPRTLGTMGIDELDGTLHPGLPFSAHPKLDPFSGELLNFGVSTVPGLSPQSTLYLYRITLEGQVITDSTHTVPGLAFIHDFACTENYYIFLQNPMALDPLPFLLGWKGAGECLRLAEGVPMRILLVPRAGGPLVTVETEPFFVFHHVNAFERDGRVVVDSVRYEEYLSAPADRDFRQTDFTQVPPGRVWRTEIDLGRGRVETRALCERPTEFPQVHPERVGRPYRYAYLGTTHGVRDNAPLQAILKLDTETGHEQIHSFAPTGFVGEPVFIPRPDATREDDGWLLVLVYSSDEHRSEFVILDANDLDRPPLTRLKLKHHVPYGLHGTFTSEVFCNP